MKTRLPLFLRCLFMFTVVSSCDKHSKLNNSCETYSIGNMKAGQARYTVLIAPSNSVDPKVVLLPYVDDEKPVSGGIVKSGSIGPQLCWTIGNTSGVSPLTAPVSVLTPEGKLRAAKMMKPLSEILSAIHAGEDLTELIE